MSLSTKDNASPIKKKADENNTETADVKDMETDEPPAKQAHYDDVKSEMNESTATVLPIVPKKEPDNKDDVGTEERIVPKKEPDSKDDVGTEERIVSKKEPGNEKDVAKVIAPVRRTTIDPAIARQNLKWNLRVIISNLYMKTEERLPGASVPICLHNTSQCVSKHRCSMLPNAPDISIAQELRNNLHNQHYDTFLDMLEVMALQSVYPDESGFDRLFDMMMVLTNKTLTIEELQCRYINVIRVFYLLLDAFPPCWKALRPYYLNFLGVTKPSEQKPQKLQLLLNLYEECLDKCSVEELSQLTNFYEVYAFDYTDEENGNLSQESIFLRHVQDYDWQNAKQWTDEFNKMSAPVRLARLSDALSIVCWVLEREFMAWLDHNRMQQAESEIFQEETKPFVLIVFGMKPNGMITNIMHQLLRLYSRAAAKSMNPERLGILQRFISLIMEASNTAELEYVENALIYPSLGTQTRRLIDEFFKIFKTENPTIISTYIKIIPQLKQRYLRFEFANHFLQLFYCSKAPFGPEKICNEFKNKQWLKYKPRSSIEADDDEQLSREDYLNIMLNALKDYCLWLNLQPCWKYMKTKVPVQQLQTRTTSKLATPVGVVTADVGKMFMLDEMQKEAHTWKERINANCKVSRPKVNLPVARINTNKMAEVYGNNIRQLRYLRRVLVEVMRFVDVTYWLNYVNEFLGEDEPTVSAEHSANKKSAYFPRI